MDMGLLVALLSLPVADTMTSAQCRAARALLNWTQNELAAAAEVDEATVRNFENERSAPQSATLAMMRRVFEVAGVDFTNGRQLGVKMKLLEQGHKVRLRRALERHAPTLVVGPRDVATVEEWRHEPDDPPGGRFRLRLASGASTDWLETSNFERALPEASNE
jgi:transcriptional regulator with XRE-family HTH domain